MGINPYNPPDVAAIGDSTFLRLDGANSPTTGVVTFGAQTIFNTRPRFNADLELGLATNIRVQTTPSGPFQVAISVGAGFFQIGAAGVPLSVVGRGIVFQNITTITPGAQQVARTTEGTTINSRAGQVVDFRINNVVSGAATEKGFKFREFTSTQRDAIASPTANLTIYNTTTNKLNFYNGTAWRQIDDSAV